MLSSDISKALDAMEEKEKANNPEYWIAYMCGVYRVKLEYALAKLSEHDEARAKQFLED